MKVKNVSKWIVINHQASSLFNVIADGSPRYTDVGKNKWLSLMEGLLLHKYCNREGFNINTSDRNPAYVKVRIGIIGNNQTNCESVYSCFGFGTSVSRCDGEIRNITCGNIGICGYLNNQSTAAFGYIFVQ